MSGELWMGDRLTSGMIDCLIAVSVERCGIGREEAEEKWLGIGEEFEGYLACLLSKYRESDEE